MSTSSATYAGSYIAIPTPEAIRILADRHLLPSDDQFERLTWPTFGQQHRTFKPPRLRDQALNVLHWPTGASRWATFHFLASANQLAVLRPLVYSKDNANRFIPQPLTLNDGTHSITASMYMLPPRHVAQIKGRNDLYICTLVDQRYFFWDRLANIVVEGGTTTWAQLYTAISLALSSVAITDGGSGYTVDDVLTVEDGKGTAATLTVTSVDAGVIIGIKVTTVGEYTVLPENPVNVTGGTGNSATFDLYLVPINVDTVPAAYLLPSTDFTSGYEYLPSLLDAVAMSCGQRMVFGLDGINTAQNSATAAASVATQMEDAVKPPVFSGGEFEFLAQPELPKPQVVTDLYGLLPESVTVTFPRMDNGALGTTCTPYTVTLASLNLDTAGTVPGFSGTKIVHANTIAAFTGGDTPVNDAELLAMATQIATDFYGWQLAPLDIRFAKVQGWVPDGMHDIEWFWQIGSLTTHVYRQPWNGMGERVGAHGTYGAMDYASGPLGAIYMPLAGGTMNPGSNLIINEMSYSNGSPFVTNSDNSNTVYYGDGGPGPTDYGTPIFDFNGVLYDGAGNPIADSGYRYYGDGLTPYMTSGTPDMFYPDGVTPFLDFVTDGAPVLWYPSPGVRLADFAMDGGNPQLYYPSADAVLATTNSGGGPLTLMYPDGSPLADDSPLIYYPGGTGQLADPFGLYYADGGPSQLTDSSGNLYAGGLVISDNLANVYLNTALYDGTSSTGTAGQVLSSTGTATTWSTGRRRLLADETYNLVSGSGMTLLQVAADIRDNIDLNGHDVNINLADGTYTPGAVVYGPFVGFGNVNINGNLGDATAVIIQTNSSCLLFWNTNSITVNSLTLAGVSGSGVAISMRYGGRALIADCIFAGDYTGYAITLEEGSFLEIVNCQITGSIPSGFMAITDMSRTTWLGTFDITTALSWSLSFLNVSYNSLADIQGSTISGAGFAGCTGTDFAVAGNSTINTGLAGPGFLPGSVAGTPTYGGVYM